MLNLHKPNQVFSFMLVSDIESFQRKSVFTEVILAKNINLH